MLSSAQILALEVVNDRRLLLQFNCLSESLAEAFRFLPEVTD